MIIDTHCHLFEPEYDEDRDEMMSRARAAGVEHFVLPNINVESIERLHRMAENDPEHCHAAMGLHPTELTEHATENLEVIHAHLQSRSYCAVGEIGLDYYWDDSGKDLQIRVFEQQMEWAKAMNLPVLVHSRNAFEDTLNCIRNMRCERGIWHCFGGTRKEAELILSEGDFCLGIGGIVTYKKAGLQEELSGIPLDSIVLETDSPYLTPVPYRGKRNEPSYLTFVIRKLSEIYKKDETEIVKKTSENAEKVLKILPLRA